MYGKIRTSGILDCIAAVNWEKIDTFNLKTIVSVHKVILNLLIHLF